MVLLIILIIIAVIAFYVYQHNSSVKRQIAEYKRQAAIKFEIGGGSDAPVQKLKYFCIKDKGYHVSVWPKDQNQFDIVEFTIAGISHRDNIGHYLGEFQGTLKPEPTNPYDPNAIKVLAQDGHHVGYVPKDMTAEIRKEATLPCPCFFYIGIKNDTYFSDCYILRH